jgi:phenylalanyl-tRNA synthetase beta chain
LIEEVARIHGYDRIGVTIPHSPGIVGGKKYDSRLDQAKELLRAQGFSETLTHSLSSPKLAFGKVTAWNEPFIEISNPVSAEFSCMRTSLLPGLIAFAQQSIAYQEENLAVFEAGRCYYPASQGGGPREEKKLALLATGAALENSLKLPVSQRLADFLDIKGALSLLFERLLGEQFELAASEHNLMGEECCAIKWQGQGIGHIGRLRREVEREIRARHCVYCAEFAFQPLEDWPAPASAYVEAARYPHSARDIAVVVSSQQKFAEVEACIRQAAGPHFESLELFDVFTGKQLGVGKKSLAFRLIFRRPDGTLTDEAVSGAMEAIQLRLQKELGASIREP